MASKNKRIERQNWNTLRFKILERDGFQCKYCGRSPMKHPDIALHVDHINPISKNGSDHELNLITSCNECNLGKMARPLEGSRKIRVDEYIARQNKLAVLEGIFSEEDFNPEFTISLEEGNIFRKMSYAIDMHEKNNKRQRGE